MEARNELVGIKKSIQFNQLENEDSKAYLLRLTSLLLSIKTRSYTDNRYPFLLDFNKKKNNINLGYLRTRIKKCIQYIDSHSLLIINNDLSVSLLMQFAKTCEITLFQILFFKIAPLLNEPQIIQVKKELTNVFSKENTDVYFKLNQKIIAKNFDLINSWIDEEIQKYRSLCIRK